MRRRLRAPMVAGAALLLAVALLGAFFYWQSRARRDAELPLSLSDAFILLNNRWASLPGPGPFDWRKAMGDGNYLKQQGRLFLGGKSFSVATPNAPLRECALGLAEYARYSNVVISQDITTTHIGAFYSGKHLMRWGAANAIRKLIDDAGLRVLELTNDTLVILTPQNYELFLTAASGARQEAAVKDFDTETNAQKKQETAGILSNLWQAGFLEDATKKKLLEEHYRLVLDEIQLGPEVSEIRVQCDPTFPFPEVFADYTPTLYVN